MSRLGALLLIPAIAILSGCATNNNMYYWGNYENSLYAHYQHPEKLADFAQSLKATIDEAQAEQKPIPPGVYAEYGYLMMKTGHPGMAVQYFELEKQHWPEAAKLMDKMIAAVHGANSKAETAQAGGAE